MRALLVRYALGLMLALGLTASGWAQTLPLPPSSPTVACPAPDGALFALGFAVGTDCGQQKFITAQNLFDGAQTLHLTGLVPAYTGSEIATLNVFFNSLPMTFSYQNAGATGIGAQLILDIPALGISQTFQGADRDASERLAEEFLKNSGIIGRIMQYQAAHSPHSPISGPGGLIPTAVATDFNEVFNTMPSKAEGEVGNVIGVGAQYSSMRVKGLSTNVYTLPLSYTIRNNIDPRRQLVFSMPITLVDTNGAQSYQVGLGGGYRIPLNDAWTITPALRTGVVVSPDIATVAGVMSGSLASTYVMRFTGFDMAVGNMVGYYTTTRVKAGKYSFDPKIANTVLRNGVMVSQPVSWGGSPMSLEYSLIDTRYLGTDVYVDATQEIGITLGTNRSAFSARSFVRGGLNVLFGRDTFGVSANIGYWF